MGQMDQPVRSDSKEAAYLSLTTQPSSDMINDGQGPGAWHPVGDLDPGWALHRPWEWLRAHP
jgi:hypothetical protein